MDPTTPTSPRKDKPFPNRNRPHHLNQRPAQGNEIKTNNMHGNSQMPSGSRRLRAYTACARLPTLVSAIPTSVPTHNFTSCQPCSSSALFNARLHSQPNNEPKERNKCVVSSAGRQDVQRYRLQLRIQPLVECHGLRTQGLLKSNQLLVKPRVHRLAKLTMRPRGGPLTDNSFSKEKRKITPIVGVSSARCPRIDPHPDATHAPTSSLSEASPRKAIFNGLDLEDSVVMSSDNILSPVQNVFDLPWAPLDDQEKEYLEKRKELPGLFRCMLEDMQRAGPSEICDSGPNTTAMWMLEWLKNAQRHSRHPVSGLDEISKDTAKYENESNAMAHRKEHSEGAVLSKVWDLGNNGRPVNTQVSTMPPFATDALHSQDIKTAVSSLQKLVSASTIPSDHSTSSSTVWNTQPAAVATTGCFQRVFPELVYSLTLKGGGSSAGTVTTSSDDAAPPWTPKEASYLPSELRSASRQKSKRPYDIAEQSFLNHLQSCLKHLGEESVSESEEETFSMSLNATNTIPSTSRPLQSSTGIDILLCSNTTNSRDHVETTNSGVLDVMKQAHDGDNHRERSPQIVHSVPPAAAALSAVSFSVLPQAQPQRCLTDAVVAEGIRMSPRTKGPSSREGCSSSKIDEIPCIVALLPPHPAQSAASVSPPAPAGGVARHSAPPPPSTPPSYAR